MIGLLLVAQVTEEAPSSVSGNDHVRSAVVLAVCLLAILILTALTFRQARRRNHPRTGQDEVPQGDLKPDQNGNATPRPR